MQLLFRNTVKYIIYVLCLILPFLVGRLWLILSKESLTISNWSEYFYYSLRFDLKAMSIWYSPLFLVLLLGIFVRWRGWKTFSIVVFGLLFITAFVFNAVAILYYPVGKTIVGVELFQLLKGQSIIVIFGYLQEYWILLLIILIVVFSTIRLVSSLSITYPGKSRYYFTVFNVLIVLLFARGSVSLKPLSLVDAYAKLLNEEVASAVTPVYVLIESFNKQQIDYKPYYSDQELAKSLEDDYRQYSTFSSKQPNICLILLESFGKEYTGINKCGRPSYTPFLDSLMSESINFTSAYANGLRSIDAVASCYSGIPSLMKQPFIGSRYSQADIKSLPTVLGEIGYETSFFHGADELSMGFKPYLESAQIGAYYAEQDYPNPDDFDGTWGIYDGPFLQFCKTKLTAQKQPWFSGIFTLSSHHPYNIPSEYQNLPKGSAEIHQSILYADKALQLFFDLIKTEPWFDNTIFIITADHTSINETPEYQNYRGKYAVPLLIYAPEFFSPVTIEKPVQHIDIFTTVQYLSSCGRHLAFGENLLDTTRKSDIILFDGNVHVLVNDSFALEWHGEQFSKLFEYQSDPIHLYDIALEKTMLRDSLMQALKLYKQKFNYRLLNNNFTVQ